jgi:uncharacterized protein (DUF1778 family)
MDDIQTFLTYPTKQELNKIKNAAKKVRQSASSFMIIASIERANKLED